MARPRRIQFPNALYHVTSRGNARADIFLAGSDRHLFLDTLGEVIERYRWLCHAYCLMPNHYHLLIQTPEANLSQGMRQLNGVYTQRVNRRHDRVGHLFQGRFKGILVERESHLLELARYVVLNPVRAGMTRHPEEYSWSSLRATLGLAPAPGWLSVEELLKAFGSRQRYRDFVLEGMGATPPWTRVRHTLLGSQEFVDRLGGRLGLKAAERGPRDRPSHRARLRAAFPTRVVEDRSSRDERIRELRRAGRYSVAEIARHLGLHRATVFRISSTDPPAMQHRRGQVSKCRME